MKKVRERKSLFRFNSPATFGILCALLIALAGGCVYALAEGVGIPAVERLQAANATPVPSPSPTPQLVITPDPEAVQKAMEEGTFATVDPHTGEVIVQTTPTPTPEPTPEPTPTPKPLDGVTIVIDAAKSKGAEHKGVTSKTYEYKINLAFAQALQEQLVDLGAKVVMTRESNEKAVGASSRIKTINTSKADLAVSLMCNDVSNSSVRGAEAIVAKGANQYDSCMKLARAILNGYSNATSMPVRETGDGTVRIMTSKEVLNGAKIPMMGLVLGQLSNKSDDANLNDAAFIAKAARGMASGIRNYLGK